jgi:hypothetical protein
VIKIEQISWIWDNKRVQVSSVEGKFPVRHPRDANYLYYLTAVEFVRLPHVLSGDPVIILNDGDRVRMCQGGDPKALRVDAECMLMSHDKRVLVERRIKSIQDTDPGLPPLDLDYLRR